MSYGIVRVQKFSSGSVKGIEIHDRREKEGISHTNKDIDWERTQLNYDLCDKQNTNYIQAVKKRISELPLKKAVRKDAVVMAQVLVTSDKEFFDKMSLSEQQEFFKRSYDWLCERYGSENVISATVHLDERTPHMHFNFVPVTTDQRLSAKALFPRQALIGQQDLFHKNVGKDFGLLRGERKEISPEHLEVAKFKEQTLQKKLANLQAEITSLRAEYDARKAYITECDKSCNISTAIPDYAKESKTIFGKETITVPKEKWLEKHVSANEKADLKKATEEFTKAIEKKDIAPLTDKYEREIARLKKKVRCLENDKKTYRTQLESLVNKEKSTAIKHSTEIATIKKDLAITEFLVDKLPTAKAEYEKMKKEPSYCYSKFKVAGKEKEYKEKFPAIYKPINNKGGLSR